MDPLFRFLQASAGNGQQGGRDCQARLLLRLLRQAKDDLQRQIAFMQEKCPGYEIVTDVGSGINFNFKRKGLRIILERALNGEL